MAGIDWNHWQPAQLVELWQAVMLSCDEEPGDEDSIENELPSNASVEAARRARIAGNAVAVQLPVVRQNAAYFLRSTLELADFAAWAIAQNWMLPDPLVEMASPKSGVKSTSKAEADCEQWLVQLVRDGQKNKSKSGYFTEAKGKFPRLSERGFNKAWDNATAGNEQWRRPGRRRKS